VLQLSRSDSLLMPTAGASRVLLHRPAPPLALAGSCTQLTQLARPAEHQSSNVKTRPSVFLLISELFRSSTKPQKRRDQFREDREATDPPVSAANGWASVGVRSVFTPAVLISGWNVFRSYHLRSCGHRVQPCSTTLQSKQSSPSPSQEGPPVSLLAGYFSQRVLTCRAKGKLEVATS